MKIITTLGKKYKNILARFYSIKIKKANMTSLVEKIRSKKT